MKIERLIDTKLSVMIVDDEEDIRETLRAYLEMMDLFSSIVEASDGGDAFTKTQNQKFDLVILDLMMPRVNGITFVENLTRNEVTKTAKEKTSIIMLSGSITNSELSQAIKAGLKNVLTKPCSAQDFSKRVQEVLIKEKPHKIRILK